MKKISLILGLAAAISFFTTSAFALTVTATSISSGVYEDGKFTPTNSGFTAEYTLDENTRMVRLTKIIDNDREGKAEEGALYEITNMSISEGLSAFTVSRNKMGQKIITAVREGALGASETLIIGRDFYEYSKAENGKFYLEYGKVTYDNQ
ncbi:MAG: hypothetical protein HQ594_01275 [Candidatus Omnitrophica bacterium]|nr:hypothetical protein [Candidatus Omnitrophota bacterium]